jgi:CheY-like chemotaxis protein
MMPVMDGFKFLRTLLENNKWRTLPILAVIARELTMEQRLKLQEGARGMVALSSLSCESFLQEIAKCQRKDVEAGLVRV